MKFKSERVFITSRGRRVKLIILKPKGEPCSGRTGILWIHGGGYITGMAEMVYMSRARALVEKYGAVVVSPAYTLAGRRPFPAALIDCHNALKYLAENAHELGVRRDQLMVGGESAGGGLAAALSIYERDIGGISIAFQMPLYPMLDCEDTASSRDNHAPVWNTARNRRAWKKYLKNIDGEVSAYASPARCSDYSGLPPAYTFVCTAEPFLDETVFYIRNLKKAGIEAEIDVYPDLFHAFDMLLPFIRVSKRAAERFEERYKYAAAHYFAPQPREKNTAFMTTNSTIAQNNTMGRA